jgi:hypothetical protein
LLGGATLPCTTVGAPADDKVNNLGALPYPLVVTLASAIAEADTSSARATLGIAARTAQVARSDEIRIDEMLIDGLRSRVSPRQQNCTRSF